MSGLTDVTIRCADCGRGFVWGGREQELYRAKGSPPPTRCKPCKQAARGGPPATEGGRVRVEIFSAG